MHPIPRFSRAKPAAAAIRRKRLPQAPAVVLHANGLSQAAGVQSPAVCFAAIGRARGASLLCAGVVPVILLRNVPGTPWKSAQVPSDEIIYTSTSAAVPLGASSDSEHFLPVMPKKVTQQSDHSLLV